MTTSFGDSGKTLEGDSSGKLPCFFHNCFQSTSFMKHTKPTRTPCTAETHPRVRRGIAESAQFLKQREKKGRKLYMAMEWGSCYCKCHETVLQGILQHLSRGGTEENEDEWLKHSYRKNPSQRVCAAETTHPDCLIIIFLMQQSTVW